MTASDFTSGAAPSSYGLDQLWQLEDAGGHLSSKGMRVAALLSIPALVASLSRALEHGWHGGYLVYVAAAAAVAAAAVLGARLQARRRAYVLIGLLLATGVTETLMFGLAGAGTLMLATAAVLSALAFGSRAALAVLAVGVIAIVLASLQALSDPARAAVAAGEYVGSVTAWIPVSVLLAVLVYLMIAGIGGVRAATYASTDALRERESVLRAFMDNAPQAVSLKSRDGRYVMVNPAFTRLVGHSHVEIIGRTEQELGLWGDTQLSVAISAQEQEVIDTRAAVTDERSGPTPAGGDGHWSVIKFPVLDTTGDVVAIGTINVDMTEARAVERALRESEESFRNLIQGSIQGIAIHRDWEPLFANRAFARIFGFETPREILARKSIRSLIAPHEHERLNSYLDARMRGDYAPAHYEFDAVRADGSVMTLQSIASATTWQGEPAIQFAVIDVTERNRASKALRESESRLAAFFDNSPHALTIKDLDGRYVKVNPAAARITGFDKEVVPGKQAYDFYSTEAADQITLADREVKETLGAVAYEHSLMTAVGERVIFAVGFPIMGADGEITGIGRIGTDVTERRRAEEAQRASDARMQAFFEHSPHSLTIKDLEGRYIQANPAAADIAGATTEQLIGKRATDFYSAEHAGIIEAFDQRVKDTLGVIEYEQTLHAPSGDRYLWGVGFPILGADGELVALGRITTDVSERKRAEQALQVSEARFRAFFENSPHAMIIQDREGRYTEQNDSAVDLFSIEVEDYIGKLIEEVWPPEIAARSRELNDGVLETGKAVEYETDFAGPERSAWVQVVKFPIADEENRQFGIGTIFSDITGRKLAEDALLESRQRFRDFAEASSDWFWEAGPDLSFTYVSERCSRLLNLEDLSRLELSRLRKTKPRDSALRPDTARRFRRALDARQPFRDFEFSIEDGWGRTRYIRIGAKAVLDREGNFGGYRGVGSDVTEALENQRQANALRDAIKQSSDGVLLFDGNDRVVFSSDEFHRMHPHAPTKEAIVGMSRADVVRSIVEAGWVDHPVARADPEAYLAEMLNRSLRDESRVDEQSYNNGRTYLRRYRRTGDGDALVLLTDITERKESERRLEAYQAELRRLASEVSLAEERERRRIAAELHDGAVQNLGLARIKLGFLRSRSTGEGDGQGIEEVRSLLERSIREVRSLVAELSPPMLYELGLEPAIEWLADRFRSRHGLDCEVELDETATPLSSDVEIFLFQAVRELLVNVVKHADAEHVVIAVHRSDGAIEITVRDDGVGIEPAKAGARPTDSSGFGLFSVRERIELLGGEMRIKADGGTRITIRAPLEASQRAQTVK